MKAVAGVDLGGSGSRIAMAGAVPGSRELHGTFAPSVIESYAIGTAVIEALSRMEGHDGSPAVLCIGTTGMPGILTDPASLAALLFERTKVDTVIIAGDCLTTHVGALGGQTGAVVAAGTGAIALGTDLESTWRRVDGWGYLFGDEGSGSWIGRKGIAAGLSALDKRGGSPMLLNLLRQKYESTDALLQVYQQEWPASHLAKFAPVVAEAAHRGDTVAAGIWAEAARRLAVTVTAAVGDGVPARVSWGGGLFRAGELLRRPFVEALQQHCPQVQVLPPSGGSLDGSLTIARRWLAGRRLPHIDYHHSFER